MMEYSVWVGVSGLVALLRGLSGVYARCVPSSVGSLQNLTVTALALRSTKDFFIQATLSCCACTSVDYPRISAENMRCGCIRHEPMNCAQQALRQLAPLGARQIANF
ncbi:MAG TPA: hypothetical protein VGC55_12725 [Dokdonella sp.]